MPDIAMCMQNKCKVRDKCYRFNASPDYMQTYVVISEEELTDKGCEMFFKLK